MNGPSGPIDLGNSFNLGSSVYGSGTYSFQWLRNGLAIPGANGSTLYNSNASLEDAGAYRLRLTQDGATIDSEEITVRIKGNAGPIISRHPSNHRVIPGSSQTLYVNVYGRGIFNYQWFRNGEPLSNQTSSNFRVTDLEPSLQNGSFTVEVSNSSGSVLSQAAIVTLADPSLPVILRHPSSQTVTQGNYASMSVSADSGPPPTYQWFRDGSALTGETSSGISLFPSSPNYISGNYHVAVTSPVGTVISESATVVIGENATPTDWFIRSHPDHTSITPGGSAHLNVDRGYPRPKQGFEKSG